MQPSAKQLIDGIDWALLNKVAPVVDDQWAASTLRSVHCLLQHLSERVDHEGQLLFDDNRAARLALGQLAQLLDGCGGAIAAFRERAAEVLDRSWCADGAYPTVARLDDENRALREVVDDAVRAVYADVDLDADDRRRALEIADEYIRERLQRDQPLFVPAFLASPF